MKKSLGPGTILYPAPVLVVGTYDGQGKPNVMTAAWGGICCSDPPCVAVSLRKATHTYGAIVERKCFTVSIPSERHVVEADCFGITTGRKTDKFALTGLTPVRSGLVDAPYVEEFPFVLECRLLQSLEIGLHTQFIGEILDLKAEESVLPEKDGRTSKKSGPSFLRPESAFISGWGKNWEKPSPSAGDSGNSPKGFLSRQPSPGLVKKENGKAGQNGRQDDHEAPVGPPREERPEPPHRQRDGHLGADETEVEKPDEKPGLEGTGLPGAKDEGAADGDPEEPGVGIQKVYESPLAKGPCLSGSFFGRNRAGSPGFPGQPENVTAAADREDSQENARGPDLSQCQENGQDNGNIRQERGRRDEHPLPGPVAKRLQDDQCQKRPRGKPGGQSQDRTGQSKRQHRIIPPSGPRRVRLLQAGLRAFSSIDSAPGADGGRDAAIHESRAFS